ncbi:MAG: LacI family DNA-binding transcriptional regulator [Planifilum fimeticola]
MPTIKDVARRANVSVATVSRILNNLPGYSQETKERVLKAIEELGYYPNALARGLVSKKTNSIGVLFPSVSSMFSAEILGGIEQVAHEQDSSVIVCHTAYNGTRTMKYLGLLREKQIDGVIFVSEVLKEEYYQALSEMDVPVVLISTKSERFPLPYVKVDDRSAAYSATSYLIEKGHRRIGMISGNRSDPIAGIPRVEGYQAALQDHGIPACDRHIVYADGFGFDKGLQCLPLLLSRAPEITAVFAASDEMAVAALYAANKLGIKVPDELSVMGYDNLRIAEMTVPSLTTVAQPLREMGETAARMLFGMMEEGEAVKSRIMPHRIVERESVKALN